MDDTFKSSRARGFSLIEVLVALFVLSVGMLAIANMFVVTLHDSRSALYRSKATGLAWDMIERIRANRVASDSYVTATGPAGADGACSVTYSNLAASNCSSSTMAQHDLFEWKTMLADPVRGLPDGDGSVARLDADPPQFTITVNWEEGRGGLQQSVRVVTQL